MQIYCPIFLDLERKQYICTQQFTQSMERIYLTKDEKRVLRHVKEHGKKQPRNITPTVYSYCLITLQEKGLVVFQVNYDEILYAALTIKGKAYFEQNPSLCNPIDWKWIINTSILAIGAMAAVLGLFIACNLII